MGVCPSQAPTIHPGSTKMHSNTRKFDTGTVFPSKHPAGRKVLGMEKIFFLAIMPCSKMGIKEAPIVQGFFWRGRDKLVTMGTPQQKSSKSWDACTLCSKNSAWPTFSDLIAPVCSKETGRIKLAPFTGAERPRLNNRMCDPCKSCRGFASCDVDAGIVKAGGSSQHLLLRTKDFAGVEHLALLGNNQARKRWWQPIQNA